MSKDIELHERVTSVETKVSLILTNHLPHLEVSIKEVKTSLGWILGLVVLGILIPIVLFIIK